MEAQNWSYTRQISADQCRLMGIINSLEQVCFDENLEILEMIQTIMEVQDWTYMYEISRDCLKLINLLDSMEQKQLLGDVFWRVYNKWLSGNFHAAQELWLSYCNQAGFVEKSDKDGFNLKKKYRRLEIFNLVELIHAQLLMALETINIFQSQPSVEDCQNSIGQLWLLWRIYSNNILLQLDKTYGEKIQKYIQENGMEEYPIEPNIIIMTWLGEQIGNGNIIVAIARKIYTKEPIVIMLNTNGSLTAISPEIARALVQLNRKALEKYP